MRLARRLWLRLQTLIRRKEIARRLDDEVQFHIARRVHWSSETIVAGSPETRRNPEKSLA